MVFLPTNTHVARDVSVSVSFTARTHTDTQRFLDFLGFSEGKERKNAAAAHDALRHTDSALRLTISRKVAAGPKNV